MHCTVGRFFAPLLFALLGAAAQAESAPAAWLHQQLQTALDHYRSLERAGGWPALAPGPALVRGDRGPRVRALRRRLVIGGDLRDFAIRDHFDQRLEEAVRRFQRRHALLDDGVVGPSTRAALNVPVHRRVDQLRLSIDRAAALPRDGSPYLWVNTAAARAELVVDGAVRWAGRSVVGQRAHPTPSIHSQLERLVLNPYWLVPARIARESLAPQVARDPGFLVRQRYIATDRGGHRLDPGALDWGRIDTLIETGQVRLMQRPGPRNALGQVKFLFPNAHAIYLHDTPHRGGFERRSRALSNGCVRIESALALAQMLLHEEGWSRQRLDAAIASGQAHVATLSRPPSLHTLYLTAAPGPAGLHFYPDRYRRDTAMALAALD